MKARDFWTNDVSPQYCWETLGSVIIGSCTKSLWQLQKRLCEQSSARRRETWASNLAFFVCVISKDLCIYHWQQSFFPDYSNSSIYVLELMPGMALCFSIQKPWELQCILCCKPWSFHNYLSHVKAIILYKYYTTAT